MIFISHRGNVSGELPYMENNPSYIDYALHMGYDVEIDLRMDNGYLYLGHDEPLFKIDVRWIIDRCNWLWIHCKDVESIQFMDQKCGYMNYFWHENDVMTITSTGFLWVYPGHQPIKNSIAVLPELNNDDVTLCSGICSDNIQHYKKEINMTLQSCLFWEGYTGQRPPKCNNGNPCVQCKSKFVKARAWEVRSGMWVSPYDQTAYTLDEAHQIELERYGQ